MQRREFLKRGLALTAGAALSRSAFADALAAAPPSSPSTTSRPTLLDLDRLTGHVILRGDPDYDDARLGRNTNASSYPAVIVFCREARDAVHAVNWAREHGVPLRVRCGRHSYEGYSSVDNGIVIDIHDLRGIRYDPAGGVVRVGAGISLAKLYEALWQHGVTIPGGSCPTVGLAGHALGGGYGLLARHFGLACDSMVGVEIVTADGRVVRANAREHPDLLWASRGGGGGSFGVVTAFTFKVHPIDKVSIFRLTWNWSDLESVLGAWQSWAPATDHRLTSVLVLKSSINGGLYAVGQFVGGIVELDSLLAPLKEAAVPQRSSMKAISFMDAMQTFSGQRPNREGWHLHWAGQNTHFKNSSDYANQLLGSDALSTVRHALETAPGNACLVQLEAYGGAINNIASDATAFVHRAGTLFNLQYQAYWGHDEDSEPYVAWVEAFRRSMQPYVSGGAYCNYCDSQILDWPRAYYGDNLERLIGVKKRYDPHGLFCFPQSIPLT